MKIFGIIFMLFLSATLGCEKAPSVDQSGSKEGEKKNIQISKKDNQSDGVGEVRSFQPFYIYSDKGSRDNHYVPSGFMPNGKCIAFNDAWMENCYEGKSCMKTTYDVECSRKDQKWAGVYWLNPANNWGKRKGGYNLTGAKKLTFWAKGHRGGEQIQELTVGGISGDYPDSDISVIGPIILSAEWREYTIDLRGKDLSYISGGFAWTTSEEVNPETCTFYIDEIKFE